MPMIEVKIPKSIKIGGFTYKIDMSQTRDSELKNNGNFGECSVIPRKISIATNLHPQQTSETFIHEVLHSIDDVYGHYQLTEEQCKHLSSGLLQVFEQLGIRFVCDK